MKDDDHETHGMFYAVVDSADLAGLACKVARLVPIVCIKG